MKWRRKSIKIIVLLIAFFAGFLASFIVSKLLFDDDELNSSENALIFDNLERYFLITLIFTSVKNFARRNVIRQTWLNLGEDLQFKYYFVIGTNHLSPKIRNDLNDENKNYSDLLLLPDLSDTYANLSLKVIYSFKWLIENQAKFQFLLKVDDDSFVRIDSLYRYLEQKSTHTKPIYLGFFDGRAHVKQKGAWKENDWFLCDRYLPYAVGGGYVLSHKLIRFISDNSDLLQLYKSEDVSLGTWLAPLSIHRIHEINFDTEYKSRGCVNSFLIQHKQSVSDMKLKYNSLINYGHLCSNKEFENRLTYEYNWNVPPSKCCIRNKTMIDNN